MTQAIRNFAKSLESWLTHAMVNIPEEMLRVKVRGRGTSEGRGKVFAGRGTDWRLCPQGWGLRISA